ncbi:hypothetical protein GBA52_014970 [Prunus armeniaca]|nr:hypothetical protein GBA52_014970 [Prunus armeniaca]
MITRRIAQPSCWRRIIQISALSTFDGRIVAYHGGGHGGDEEGEIRRSEGSDIQGEGTSDKQGKARKGKGSQITTTGIDCCELKSFVLDLGSVVRSVSRASPARLSLRRYAGLALIGRVVLRTTAKAFAKDVFINQERKLGARRRSDTVLVSTINDADQGSADVTFRTPPAPYEKSKFLGSGGSMVARLKLKGIDGRAPPGVEPAA